MGTFREKNGRIEYRFSYKDPFGKVIRKSVMGFTKDECLAKVCDVMETNGVGSMQADDQPVVPTIAQLLKEKITGDFRLNAISESTYRDYMRTFEIIRSNEIANAPVTLITKEDLEGLVFGTTEYAERTVKKVNGQLAMAMQIAKSRGYIEVNPMKTVAYKRPKSKRGSEKIKAFTKDEQAKFERVLSDFKVPKGRNNYKLQLYIALYSGLRMGEINALKAKDINMKTGMIRVSNTVARGLDYRSYIKEAKTSESCRLVPISKKLRPLLKELLKTYSRNPEGLLFYDFIKGDVITTSQVNNFFRRVLEKTDIEMRGQHALRHTFATRCIESGVSAQVLSRWMGHTDIHMTLDTYADVFDSLSKDSIKKVEER